LKNWFNKIFSCTTSEEKNSASKNYWKNDTFSKCQKVNNIWHAVPFFWPSVRVPASKWGGGSWFCRSILKR
jgi:hypothetical protein